jgi:ribosomal protein S21
MKEIKRKEGESVNALMYRFTKKMQPSGILKESKKRRNYIRPANKTGVRASAAYRSAKKVEIVKQRKLGK